MWPDVAYFIILLCLTLHDFTCQGESTATQWVNMANSHSQVIYLFIIYENIKSNRPINIYTCKTKQTNIINITNEILEIGQ